MGTTHLVEAGGSVAGTGIGVGPRVVRRWRSMAREGRKAVASGPFGSSQLGSQSLLGIVVSGGMGAT